MAQDLINCVDNSNDNDIKSVELATSLQLIYEIEELQVLINIVLEQGEEYADMNSPLHRVTILLELYQSRMNCLIEDLTCSIKKCQKSI